MKAIIGHYWSWCFTLICGAKSRYSAVADPGFSVGGAKDWHGDFSENQYVKIQMLEVGGGAQCTNVTTERTVPVSLSRNNKLLQWFDIINFIHVWFLLQLISHVSIWGPSCYWIFLLKTLTQENCLGNLHMIKLLNYH